MQLLENFPRKIVTPPGNGDKGVFNYDNYSFYIDGIIDAEYSFHETDVS